MIFDDLVRDLTYYPYNGEPKNISKDEYEEWKKQFTWDALQNQRYGQSFCNYFNIQDHRIFFERDHSTCDFIIRNEWLATS